MNWVFIAPTFSLRVHEGPTLTEGHNSYLMVLSTHSLWGLITANFPWPFKFRGNNGASIQPISSSVVFLLNPSQMIPVWLCLCFSLGTGLIYCDSHTVDIPFINSTNTNRCPVCSRDCSTYWKFDGKQIRDLCPLEYSFEWWLDWYLLSTHYVAGTVQSALCALTYMVFPPTLWGRDYEGMFTWGRLAIKEMLQMLEVLP